ncbi:MAG: hypothetical protein KGR47_06090 [Acidobacteria bacterium]|nr:hypothetical protein [Acidobacteriota bacterium]
MSRRLASIDSAELQLVRAALGAVRPDETEGEYLRLRAGDGHREWWIEGQHGEARIRVPDPESTAVPHWYAASERLCRFAEVFVDRSPVVISVVDGRTLMAEAEGVSAAIDTVQVEVGEPGHHLFQPVAESTVSLHDFAMVLWSARSMPLGVDDSPYPYPTMWLRLGAGWAGLHVDWSDFVPSRSTYRVDAAQGSGDHTVGVPHGLLDSFLGPLPYEDLAGEPAMLHLAVGTVRLPGGHTREALRIEHAGIDWFAWLTDPLEYRWASKVEAEFERAGVEVRDRHDGEWHCRHEGTSVRARLHGGNPDIVRVSATLLTGAHESVELLRELSQLNAAATGVRYWLQDDTVRIAYDVKCTVLSGLSAAVEDVATAAATYAPVLAAFA